MRVAYCTGFWCTNIGNGFFSLGVEHIAFAKDTYSERLSFEKRLYEVADAIITTPILHKQWVKDYPDAANSKIVSMEFPNVNPKQLGSLEMMGNVCKQEYSCVFAGGLYKAARNPAYTINLFSALNGTGIKLSFIGAEKENMREFIDEEEIASNIFFYGRLPLKEAQRHMEQADILVNIGNIMTNQVPSKIFEYISQGKPIVNVCVNHDCPTIPYLAKYPYVLNLFEEEDVDEQARKLEGFIREYAGKRVSTECIVKEYEGCTAAWRLCAQMWKALTTCCMLLLPRESSVWSACLPTRPPIPSTPWAFPRP